MTLFSKISDRLRRQHQRVAPTRAMGAAPPHRTIELDPFKVFSPDPAQINSHGDFDNRDDAEIQRLKNDKVFYKDIPYSKYLGEWHFHPNRIGGYLTVGKLTPQLSRTAKSLLDWFVELPNGGLALYYPPTIRTTRLQVNEPIYSGIAQGQLLAGYTRLIRDQVPNLPGCDWREIAERIARSLMFPFEQGGICIDGKIIMEAPNFRACPEIILNGWLDALIRFHDYLQIAPNAEFSAFYDRNIAALCELLPDFDDQTAHLSLYSNLCPYVFRVHHKGLRATAPRVSIDYMPTRSGYAGYRIADLWQQTEAMRKCAYENAILRTTPTYMDLSLSVCSLYDLSIAVDGGCSRISFDPGTYNEHSTVPAKTQITRSLTPDARAGKTTHFTVRAREQNLMAGCPTNFKKKGENFYHMYHVVALYELALTTQDRAQRKILTDHAARWLDNITSSKHALLDGQPGFALPDGFVRKIDRFRASPVKQTFEELRAKATAP